MFAIIKTGGKQYMVSEKDVLEIEKLDEVESGAKVVIKEVLLVAKDDIDIELGTPYVKGARVELKVLDHIKGEKMRGYTYQAKKDIKKLGDIVKNILKLKL
jgi:large subunit ribosomal protein L21